MTLYKKKNEIHYRSKGMYEHFLPYLDYLTPTQQKYLIARNEWQPYSKIGKEYWVSRQAVQDCLNKCLRQLDTQIEAGKVYKFTPKRK